MRKSRGSEGITLIECINPRLTKYRVRWAVAPVEETEEERGGGVEFYELEYQRKPELKTIVADIIKAMTEEPINLTEIATMAEILDEEPLEPMRKALLHNVKIYDTSPSVNGFLLNGSVEWIDIELRMKLCSRTLPEEKKAGKTSTVLWLGNKPYELPIETIEQIMHEIEIYAKACLDVTNRHKTQVLTLSDVSALVAYDYTAGYPEKLSFNI